MPSGCRPKRATWYEYRGSGAGKFTVSDTGGSTAGRSTIIRMLPDLLQSVFYRICCNLSAAGSALPGQRKRTAGRLNFTDQTPVVISYLCGGQGTVDIPGWSPDGNGVVCVSNSSPTK